MTSHYAYTREASTSSQKCHKEAKKATTVPLSLDTDMAPISQVHNRVFCRSPDTLDE